ncbi:MAG TPA: DUF308 domain-containing protein [Candidatus Saccharimonadales bacterium]|nr:DUF308 domain-containing protein [Candidatus Saccharimonadales bacterium]
MSSAQSVVATDRSYSYWRGGLGVLLGVIVLVFPKLTVLTFVTLISIWLLLVGGMRIVEGVVGIKKGGFGWLLSILVGVLELGVGAYLVQRPSLTTLSIVTLVGIVFFAQGFIQLFNTFGVRGAAGGLRVLTLLFALLSFAAGIWLWRYPFHATLAFVWLVGLFLIISGVLQIAMGSEADV